MSKFPPEYFFFIARGIVLNNKELEIPHKEAYTENELIEIFSCSSSSDLHDKLSEIENKTIRALNLPEKDFYTLEDLAKNLNMESEMPKPIHHE